MFYSIEKISNEKMKRHCVDPQRQEEAQRLDQQETELVSSTPIENTEAEIRAAVESIFSVSVTKVTTANVKGKLKRTARGMSRKKNWKKAYVTVAAGQELDYMVAE